MLLKEVPAVMVLLKVDNSGVPHRAANTELHKVVNSVDRLAANGVLREVPNQELQDQEVLQEPQVPRVDGELNHKVVLKVNGVLSQALLKVEPKDNGVLNLKAVPAPKAAGEPNHKVALKLDGELNQELLKVALNLDGVLNLEHLRVVPKVNGALKAEHKVEPKEVGDDKSLEILQSRSLSSSTMLLN